MNLGRVPGRRLALMVRGVISSVWNFRRARVVPVTSSVDLTRGAVEIEAAFLYADLASSSRISNDLDRRVAAKILKAFHKVTATLIRSNKGQIVSFDGDRILAIFVGQTKEDRAAKCALEINYAVNSVVRPILEKQYSSIVDANITIEHAVGIDTGTVLGVRAGVRSSNDLIWIGRAPNLAAKLSDIRHERYRTFITSAVHNRMDAKYLFGQERGEQRWQRESYVYLDENIWVFCTNDELPAL